MRHLKSYKLFESRPTPQSARVEADEIMSVLKDMVLEITDKDLNVLLDFKKNTGDENNPYSFLSWKTYYPDIQIVISKDDGGRFYLKEINDVVVQMVDFIELEGWKINKSTFLDYSGRYNTTYIKTPESTPILAFSIEFTKSKI
jgi:hypothetical protein